MGFIGKKKDIVIVSLNKNNDVILAITTLMQYKKVDIFLSKKCCRVVMDKIKITSVTMHRIFRIILFLLSCDLKIGDLFGKKPFKHGLHSKYYT